MFHLAGSTRCNDRNAYFLCKAGEGFIGKALLHAIVVHTREENLAGTTVGNFSSPIKQTEFYSLSSALHVAMPAVGIETGIDGADADL